MATALDGARQGAASAGRRAAEGLSDAPLLAVTGGLAIGAVVGALLPRSQRERELLAGAGGRVVESARTAAETAREAGKSKLAEFGRATVGETVHSLIGGGDSSGKPLPSS